MPTTNKVFLIGNLTHDPELRTLPTGSKVCDFSLAVNDIYTNKKTGQREEQVNYVDCVAWNQTAELIKKHFHKGRGIFVEGKLQYDQWDDRETGKKRSKLRVLVWEWRFVDSKFKHDSGVDDEEPAETRSSQDQDWEEDDVPF